MAVSKVSFEGQLDPGSAPAHQAFPGYGVSSIWKFDLHVALLMKGGGGTYSILKNSTHNDFLMLLTKI